MEEKNLAVCDCGFAYDTNKHDRCPQFHQHVKPGETAGKRESAHVEEAMRKKDERRVRLQLERDALLVVIQILAEEVAMLRKSYEKDSKV